MDHDYVFQNDFAGEVYMSLSDIPGVDGDEVSGYEALNVITLPLMQPAKKSRCTCNVGRLVYELYYSNRIMMKYWIIEKLNIL